MVTGIIYYDGNIDVGDGGWGRNMLVINLKCLDNGDRFVA